MGDQQSPAISIHALREEGDSGLFSFSSGTNSNFYPRPPRGGRLFSASSSSVSSYFYPRPPRGGRRGWRCQPLGCPQISIHALREEGDLLSSLLSAPFWDFYPRPPRGGRREASFRGCPWRIYFYPRPPRGGRPETVPRGSRDGTFLSTPSARRATKRVFTNTAKKTFLSTPSARRATVR